MDSATALNQHRRMIAEVGETISVRRYSGTGPARTYVDTQAKARVTGYAPRDLVGAIVQGDRRVIVLADTLSGVLPISTSDKLVVRGRELAIKAVNDSTRRTGGVLIALEIQAAG